MEDVDGNNEPGFLIYGAPVGTDAYCTHQLQKIAEGIVSDAQQTVELLTGERQSLWSALRCSITSRFDYWLQMSYPSVVEPVATWLDAQLWKVLESATGLTIPRTSSNTPWNCVLPIPVMERSTQTFQEWVVAGQAAGEALSFDIRSLKETSGCLAGSSYAGEPWPTGCGCWWLLSRWQHKGEVG